MKKYKLFLIFLFMSTTLFSQSSKTLYDFTATTIDGQSFPMSQLKGKKVLIVNTASKCGKTPQYAELETLYKKYGGDKFVIIGFPANNFLSQEPGTNEEIKSFCERNYGVTFPMMAKISVKGKDMDPIYQWLTQKKENGVMDAEVTWNFQKFLINEEGHLVNFFPPSEKPLSESIIRWIEGR